MAVPRVTYCGNVHPAEDVDGWIQAVERFAAPLAREQAERGRAFGLGSWWSAALSGQLARDPGALDRVRDCLERHRLELWTLNVFPFGGFHDARVKDAVYRPDWADERRLAYTLDAATAAARLVPAGSVLPLSTLPLGQGGGDLPAMAVLLMRAAAGLKELEARTGVRAVLALEPEPACLLETVAEAIELLEEVFRAAGGGPAEDALRRHLGVCVDLCHLAVVGEDPVEALAALRRAGIAAGKVQVSSALELREPRAALDRLLAFDEPRYLHQTVARDGPRALDLPEVARRRAEFEAASRVRTHFHMPVFWDEEGPLGSTRSEVVRLLGSLGDDPPLLEVETYTWTVLEGFGSGDDDLARGISRELSFVHEHLPPVS